MTTAPATGPSLTEALEILGYTHRRATHGIAPYEHQVLDGAGTVVCIGDASRVWDWVYRMAAPARKVALIACSGSKASKILPARDLYTGDLFRRSVEWAARECDAWLVLSAMHNVVRPDTRLAPYDRTMRDVQKEEGAYIWATRCRAHLMDSPNNDGPHLRPCDTAVMLAGRAYCDPLVPLLEERGVEVERPLAGMGIGRQRQWLGSRTATTETPAAVAQGELF